MKNSVHIVESVALIPLPVLPITSIVTYRIISIIDAMSINIPNSRLSISSNSILKTSDALLLFSLHLLILHRYIYIHVDEYQATSRIISSDF